MCKKNGANEHNGVIRGTPFRLRCLTFRSIGILLGILDLKSPETADELVEYATSDDVGLETP